MIAAAGELLTAAVGAAVLLVVLVVVPVVVGLVRQEAQGWIGVLPFGLLALARRRIPAARRDALYEEWSAELHAVLEQWDSRPISRLWFGLRYALGLLRAARRVARELGDARESTGEEEAAPEEATADAVAESVLADTFSLGSGHEGPFPSREFSVHGRRLRLTLRRYGTGYDPEQVEQALWKVATASQEERHRVAAAELDPRRLHLVPRGYFEAEVKAAFNDLRHSAWQW